MDSYRKPTLITTAISYPNGDPHIGHMYEAIITDFLVRSSKLFGNETYFLTGTDEHGKKIQSTAKSNSLLPIELCNINELKFRSMLKRSGINYDRFIRTTDPDHVNLVRDCIIGAEEFISKQQYVGYYNVREESYITETDASITNYKDPVTDIPYERREEENYTFKLSIFKEFIKRNLYKVRNFDTTSFNTFIENLQDLSISRQKTEEFDWGINYPNDESHIIYVWFDALLNYVTGGISLISDFHGESHKTIHVIGKDIVRFHAIIYPAILKSITHAELGYSTEYPMYDMIYVHGFVLDSNGFKMSKSLGNVIDPNYLLNKYPLEAIRYYFFS